MNDVKKENTEPEVKEEVKPEETIPEETMVPEESEEKVEQTPEAGQDSMLPPPEDFGAGPDQVGDQKIEDAGEPEVEDETYNMEQTDENAPDFEPMPLDWYKSTITDAKYKSSKAGDPMMVIDFSITDDTKPQYANRRVSLFALFKYNGKANDPVAEMGKKRFKKAMVRSGVDINWATFKPLEFCKSGIALGAKVRIKLGLGDPYTREDGTPGRSNTITDYQPIGAGEAFLSDSP